MRPPFKNTYGQTTASQCFFCPAIAITKGILGLPTCNACKDKTEVPCPQHGTPMQTMKGKFGNYFNCTKCPGNGNWTEKTIMKWRR